MTTYKYSIFVRFIFRYANFLITLIMSFYAAAALFLMFEKWYYIFVLIVNLLIIIYVNRFYISGYRYFPYKIDCDNDRLICSDFFLSAKRIEIEIKNINKITGGIFSGVPSRPVFLYDDSHKIKIGIYAHLGKHGDLLKTILQNVQEEVYNDLLSKMRSMKR